MTMDINFWRGISTVMVMIGFSGVCLWAYSGKRKEAFEKAARIPLDDDDCDLLNSAGEKKRE